MRYGKPDANQAALVALIVAHGASWQNTTVLGSGVPDGVIGYCGVDVWAEIKAGRDKKPRPNQVEWARRWKGRPVAYVPDEAALLVLLGWMRKAGRLLRGEAA